MGGILLVLLAVVLLVLKAAAETYKTEIVHSKINVHLVPHTHDDVGWLDTVDGYYEGKVKYILTEVVKSLAKNHQRKFIYVEQVYFQKWWAQQNQAVKKTVKRLVDAGQLDFANGGWCMHDEATTHYIDMIDQTTLGHLFLYKEFGKIPRIGWQIDTFGHSVVQAYLLSAELGFDGLFFARIDKQEREQRIREKSLEFVWHASNTMPNAEIFTTVFPVHYYPPPGFKYEESNEILLRDGNSHGGNNVPERVNAFVREAEKQAGMTRSNDIMWTMGDDFKYVDAEKWFNQMDKLIHYVNKDGRVKVQYSTPSIYLEAKHAANEQWPLKTNDFFPYANVSNEYWTGYFSSRSTFKGYVRQLSGYLQAARQLEFLAGWKAKGPNTLKLWEAVSTAQHHDAITGTARQDVVDDYIKQLLAGKAETDSVMLSAMACLASGDCTRQRIRDKLEQEQCPLHNGFYCPPTEAITNDGKQVVVTVYNALGWTREEYVRVPVKSQSVMVVDALGKTIPSQLVVLSDAMRKVRKQFIETKFGKRAAKTAVYWLYFKVDVPPLGFSSYYVRHSKQQPAALSIMDAPLYDNSTINLSFPDELTFAEIDEPIKISSRSRSTALVRQAYSWYAGSQNSGAYIFRPNGQTTKPVSRRILSSVVRGPLFVEKRVQFAPWVHQASRYFKGQNHVVEVEFVVGPVPVEDGIGKEVVTKFKTKIRNSKVFYTDSNGRDFIKRVRNDRAVQHAPANYYPVNLGISIRDNKKELSVLVDRAMGGASMKDGEIELMLHRQLLQDDGEGVEEPLNEQFCALNRCEGITVKGTMHVSILSQEAAVKWRRIQGQKIYSPLQLFFHTEDGEKSSHRTSYSMMDNGYSLPHNVALITLQDFGGGIVLLRLAHLFEGGEGGDSWKVAKVELRKMFSGWKIKGFKELSLSANQPKSAMKRMKWKRKEKSEGSYPYPRGGPIHINTLIVELGPMEIRTVELSVSNSH